MKGLKTARGAVVAGVAGHVLASGVLAGGCGDALVDGDDPGPPELVLEGRIAALDPNEGNQSTAAALIWTPLVPDSQERFERDAVAWVPDDVGAFQLQVFGGPDGAATSIAFLAVLEGGDGGRTIDAETLAAEVRGAAVTHYFLSVRDLADPALAGVVLNPEALVEGVNLVVGLCRPGRASQLVAVPPERITVTALSEIAEGACLDAFFGPWR